MVRILLQMNFQKNKKTASITVNLEDKLKKALERSYSALILVDNNKLGRNELVFESQIKSLELRNFFEAHTITVFFSTRSITHAAGTDILQRNTSLDFLSKPRYCIAFCFLRSIEIDEVLTVVFVPLWLAATVICRTNPHASSNCVLRSKRRYI